MKIIITEKEAIEAWSKANNQSDGIVVEIERLYLGGGGGNGTVYNPPFNYTNPFPSTNNGAILC